MQVKKWKNFKQNRLVIPMSKDPFSMPKEEQDYWKLMEQIWEGKKFSLTKSHPKLRKIQTKKIGCKRTFK